MPRILDYNQGQGPMMANHNLQNQGRQAALDTAQAFKDKQAMDFARQSRDFEMSKWLVGLEADERKVQQDQENFLIEEARRKREVDIRGQQATTAENTQKDNAIHDDWVRIETEKQNKQMREIANRKQRTESALGWVKELNDFGQAVQERWDTLDKDQREMAMEFERKRAVVPDHAIASFNGPIQMRITEMLTNENVDAKAMKEYMNGLSQEIPVVVGRNKVEPVWLPPEFKASNYRGLTSTERTRDMLAKDPMVLVKAFDFFYGNALMSIEHNQLDELDMGFEGKTQMSEEDVKQKAESMARIDMMRFAGIDTRFLGSVDMSWPSSDTEQSTGSPSGQR